MKWTTQPPTASGYYWYLNPVTREPTVVHIEDYGGASSMTFVGNDRIFFSTERTGHWYGPIKPPSLPEE